MITPRSPGRVLVARARALRREATPAERLLWSALRNHGLGAKCRRQVPMGPYVLDFLFVAERLAIELDGVSHDGAAAQAADARRDDWLVTQGIRVLRFANRDVLTNLVGVVTVVQDALREGA